MFNSTKLRTHGGRIPVRHRHCRLPERVPGSRHGWPESEIRSAQLAALSAVEAEALEKQDTGLWVLNPAPMFTLCVRRRPRV